MHALHELGYDGDNDDIADLVNTFLSVNEVRQTTADTRLEPHVWNKMSVDD